MSHARGAASVGVVLGAASERLTDAVAAQRRQPEAVVDHSGDLRADICSAVESGTDWIWVLDGRAVPQPDALLALQQALERLEGLPEPAVLSGTVLTAGNRVDPAHAPWYHLIPREAMMASARRRVVPVRASRAPVLVRRDAARAERLPLKRLAPANALLEWSARMLRTRAGYWIPESQSVAGSAAPGPLRDPLAPVAFLLGGAFGRRERLIIGFDTLNRACRVTRRPS